MSVDPFIQAPSSTQSINPYSYIMNNPLAGTDPTGYVSKCNQNPTCQMQSFFSSVGSGGSSLIGNLMGRLKTTLANGHDTKQAKKAQEPKAAAEIQSPAAVSFVLPSKDSVDRTHLANCGRIQQCSGLGNLIRNKLIPPVIGPGNSQNNSGDLSDNGNPPGVNEAYGSGSNTAEIVTSSSVDDKETIRESSGPETKSKSTPRGIVIGETQARVETMAAAMRASGFHIETIVSAWPAGNLSPAVGKAFNQMWINQKMDEGFTIYDIGLDDQRPSRSVYYYIEKREIMRRSYLNVVPVKLK